METTQSTNRGLILTAIVTIVLLTTLAALLADASIVSAQGSAPDTPDLPVGNAVFVGGVDLEWNDVPGADSYDVQLFRNGQWTDLPGDDIEIAFYGAGAIISELDPESTLWFRVRARNSHGSSDWSGWIQMNSTDQYASGRRARPDNIPADGAPVIEGTAQVGESLTADTSGIRDGNGLDRVQFRFQWVSHDGSADTDIANATDSIYTVAATDVGNTIKVRVAFTDRGGYAESLMGGETATVAAGSNSPATGQPTIAGTAQVGEALTADTSSIADADGLTNASYSYQWIANDGTADTEITGATDYTYTLVDADEGWTIKVQVSFTDDAGNEESLTSAATEEVEARPNTPATGVPAINCTAQVGEMLTVDTSGIADQDGLTSASYSYQWVANAGAGDTGIAGATDSTYTVAADDEGNTIKVRVSFTDDAGNDEELTSAATGAVEARPNSPATGAPTISGTAQVGETLTADTSGIVDADGLTNVSYSYQWLSSRDTEINGATNSTYAIVSADMGKTIKVRVSFTDDAGNDESLTSAATEATVGYPTLSVLTLSDVDFGTFASGKTSYTAKVAPSVTETTVTLRTNPFDASYVIKLGGVEDTDGTVPLSVGSNVITVEVTAEDRQTTTYTVTVTHPAFTEGICDRTTQVLSEIMFAINNHLDEELSCEDVTDEHLSQFRSFHSGSGHPKDEPFGHYHVGSREILIIRGTQLTSLKEGDFDGLGEAISGIHMTQNRLTTLPSGIFEGLTHLDTLVLYWNDIESLPDDVFEGLTRLETMALQGNNLANLPDGIFDDLTNLETLLLYHNDLTSIPEGIFDNLTNLQRLELWANDINSLPSSLPPSNNNHGLELSLAHNELTELPEGLFLSENLNITELTLHGNPGSPFGINMVGEVLENNVSNDGTRTARIRYVVREAAPVDMRAEVSVTGGSVLASSVSVTAGEMYSGEMTITQEVAGESAIVSLSNLTTGDISTFTMGVTFGVTSLTLFDDDAPVNTPATGAPTISGTAQVGETLTADTSGIVDADGLTNVSYSYQWLFSRDTEINGATSPTYTLQASDNGKVIKVRVSFTDDAGNDEELTSGATGAVEARPNSPATGAPTISGPVQVGETLTADTSGIADADGLSNVAYGYQWISIDGTSDTDIAGATDSTYTLVADDEGKTITVRVSFTDDAGNAESLTSAATEKVKVRQWRMSLSWYCGPVDWTNFDLKGCNIERPVVFGVNLREAVNDDDPSTVDYVLRMDMLHENGTDANECEGTNMGADFEVTTVDDEVVIGSGSLGNAGCEPGVYKMRCSAREGASATWHSLESHELWLRWPNEAAMGRPAIAGTAQVGETLTADSSSIVDDNGLNGVTFSYQWIRNDGSSDTDIAGGTDSTYTLVAADEGNTIRVRVSFTDDDEYTESLISEATEAVSFAVQQQVGNNPATGALTISGPVQVGETLTADTSGIADADGLSSAVYSYQWLADDADIAGATDSSYTPTDGDEGAIIKLRGSTGALTISGPVQVGETLTADTSGIADQDGLTSVAYQYQWLADDADIAGATAETYTLVDADEGAGIKVRVSFTDDAGHEETLTSAATVSVAAAESAEPPAPPTGLTAAVSHDQVVLSWDDPQDDSITGYVILRRNRATTDPGEFTELVADTGSAATTYTDNEVAAETLYTYRIKAINDHGVSEISRWVRADTPAPPVPAKPTGLTAAVSHDQVVLSWDDPQDDSITGYVILRRNRGTTEPGEFTELVADTGSAATTYTDHEVEADTSYTYRIKAINEHGVSELSRWARADTPAAP